MIRGIYAAASGMSAQLNSYQVHAANLANVNTIGYRRARIGQRSFQDDLAAARGTQQRQTGGVTDDSAPVDLRQGPLQTTGNAFDIALIGPGMLVVQTPRGEMLTRAGNLQINASGQLVTSVGYPVMGQNGPIIARGSDVVITEQGTVVVDGAQAGRLRVVEPAAGAQVTAVGGGLLTCPATGPSTLTTVHQRQLEGSNARAVEELVAMMRGSRIYEAAAEALKAQDQALAERIQAAQGTE